MAQAETLKGKKYITSLTRKSISSQNADVIADEIKQIFQSLDPLPNKIQLNIPRYLVTARALEIPSIEDQEIDKIVKMELMKYIPYADENPIYGYKIVEKSEDGYSKILLVIAQSDTINNLLYILNKAGVRGLSLLSVSSETLFFWYILTRGGDKKEKVMLVNLDLDHVDIDIVEDDKLVFTRGVSYGAKDSEEMGKIASEIMVSMNTYQKESRKTVDRIILTGGNPETVNCKTILTGESNTVVEVIDQTKDMPFDENCGLPEKDASFAELLGLCLKSEEISINLLPENARKEARLGFLKKYFITAALLCTLFVMAAFGLLLKKLHDKDIYLAAINAELKSMDPKVAAARKIMKNISVIRKTMARKPLTIDLISEIYGITPEAISFNMLDLENEKSLTIRGEAQALNDVLKYRTILEDSRYFERVKVKYTNKRMVGSKEIAEFEINAVLSERLMTEA